MDILPTAVHQPISTLMDWKYLVRVTFIATSSSAFKTLEESEHMSKSSHIHL